MEFLDVAFQPFLASFTLHFLEIVVELKTLGPQLVWVKQGHVPCKILSLRQSPFCVGRISWRSYDCHKVQVNLATLSFGDITRFKAGVFVCLTTHS